MSELTPPQINLILSKNIRQSRIKLKMSQKDVAKTIGVSQTRFSNYEVNVSHPNIYLLLKLKSLFQWPCIDDILTKELPKK